MNKYLLIIAALLLALGCSSIIDDIEQVPGDGPATDSAGDAGPASQQDGEDTTGKDE